jgi:lipoyl(octanoyl) transferase 2
MPPRPSLRINHIHLPSDPQAGRFPPYRIAALIQDSLRERLLRRQSEQDPRRPPPPRRSLTLLSFTPQPTYTLGRRDRLPLRRDAARLAAPLSLPTGHVFAPAVLPSPRGGRTTYHGPGQVVLWPVADLRALHAHPHPLRAHVSALRRATAALLRGRLGVRGVRAPDEDEDVGVWISAAPGARGRPRKIAAVGVHIRRGVAGLGTALNLDMPTTTGRVGDGEEGEEGAGVLAELFDDGKGDDDEATNPWARFEPCGISDRGVTCVRAELEAAGRQVDDGSALLGARAVASQWAGAFAAEMGFEEVEMLPVPETGVTELVKAAEAIVEERQSKKGSEAAERGGDRKVDESLVDDLMSFEVGSRILDAVTETVDL